MTNTKYPEKDLTLFTDFAQDQRNINMKVKFYPKDIGMFRDGDFDFSPIVLLTADAKCNYKVFNDKSELIDYLKSKGVRLDDAEYPLEFCDYAHHVYGYGYKVKQSIRLGFVKELL